MGNSTPPVQKRIAVTSIKIDRELLDEFKLVAAANHRSVSQQLRWLIRGDIEAFRAAQRAAA